MILNVLALNKTLRKGNDMASLIKRRDNWYARVRWYLETSRKEKQVSLKTKSKVVARERISAVNKVEADIKDGMNKMTKSLEELVKAGKIDAAAGKE